MTAAVLVVEDEPIIRMNVVDDLTDHCLQVFEAGTAREAIDVLIAHPDVGVVFTDVNMPGDMDGLALAKIVQERFPSVRILVTSGQRKIPAGEMPPGAIFLSKPYSHATMAATILDLASKSMTAGNEKLGH